MVHMVSCLLPKVEIPTPAEGNRPSRIMCMGYKTGNAEKWGFFFFFFF